MTAGDEGSQRWVFKKFVRKIAGTPPGMAYIGLRWSWEPKIWDPQLSRASIQAEFSSPNLPPWLNWSKDVLSGVPGPDSVDTDVTVEAKVTQPHDLLTTFTDAFISIVHAGREGEETQCHVPFECCAVVCR